VGIVGKNFLSWIAAGLGGIIAAGVQALQSGGGVNLKAAGSAVLVALLLRAANWVIATLGPKPA
jgi:hypothetical protein